MAISSYFLILIVSVFSSNFAECTEFVPVFMWGTNKMSEHVPALHKISQDSFKDTLLEYLKKDPKVIVFAERTLSPEDFAQRDQNGESAFVNIQQLKNEGNFVSYRPYVQNPIGAIKQVNKPITEISIESILSSVDVPKENIWIINLNDAKDGESRFHMLKRHDFDIVTIFKDVVKKNDNVLVLYTANHTAWVAPEDVTRGKSRSLLAEGDPAVAESIPWKTEGVLIYVTAPGTVYQSNKDPIEVNTSFNLTGNYTDGAESFIASLTNNDATITFTFNKKQSGYWFITKINVKDQDLLGTKDMYAPTGFSYHCDAFNLTDKNKTVGLNLPGFQIQAYGNNSAFGDAYDCVGFTSVPIWSGLFVTAILLLIITIGLTMMMDIKTMDRFDDPKGKTITVNVSE